MIRLPILLLLLSGCSSYLAMSQEEQRRSTMAVDELRIAIADLKHALHSSEVEISLIEERLKKQEAMLLASRQAVNKSDHLGEQIALLEKRITYLQNAHEETLADLERLRTHANETSKSLKGISKEIQGQNSKFDEIGKLKTTLGSLSQAIRAGGVHTVKSGESLEKIAREHQTTVAELKRVNKLQSDTIFIGQELQLP